MSPTAAAHARRYALTGIGWPCGARVFGPLGSRDQRPIAWRRERSHSLYAFEEMREMTATVQDLLNRKSPDVVTVSPDASVYDAVALMAHHQIGALVVMSDDKIAGIVTERDYARKVILRGRETRETQVREIMTTKVVCVGADQSVEDCMALMTGRRVRHLPVIGAVIGAIAGATELVGIVSMGDAVKSAIADREIVIDELERYIAGGR
jgi:CBS domain-containing protein